MKNIAVIGAGTMGHALAQVFAQGGYRVSLHDLFEEGLNRAKQLIPPNLETLFKAGLFDRRSGRPCTTCIANQKTHASGI